MTGLVLVAKLTTPQESTCDQSREYIVQSHNRKFHGNRIRGNPTRHLSESSGDEIRDAFTSGEIMRLANATIQKYSYGVGRGEVSQGLLQRVSKMHGPRAAFNKMICRESGTVHQESYDRRSLTTKTPVKQK